MINFKKAYITKIICIFIVNSFVATNFIYSYPLSYSDTLRVPVDIENTQGRMKEVIEKTDSAALKDKKDLPSYSSMVDIFSNKLNRKEELDERGIEPARKKFNKTTLKSEIFSGNTVVVWFDEETNKKLIELKRNIESKLKQLALQRPDKYGDLQNKIAFVNEDSFHLTLYDLVNPDDFKHLLKEEREKKEKEINVKIHEIFKYLTEQENLSPIRIEIKTLGSFTPFLLLALGYPKTQEDLDRINTIRGAINKGTGINLANPFVAHITLGYIVNPMNEDEYAVYKEIVDEIIGEVGFKLDIILDNLQLREFKTMDDYGRDPIERVSLASGETVLEITSPKSSQIGLVGGKAASLKELGSIEGVKVPDGFNVTTKVYADYLKSVGAEPLINKLEILSEEWKKLDEENSAREELTVQMRELSGEIQDLILKGEISSEIRQVVLVSYKNLEKDGIPALVAVRSSATAEDMPGASFAGQYRTYLNVQGDDQVIEAIKKVWASTYEMNAVEYRNKQNMQHSKNKMGALILEMVNPQSAGTAFTVDLETGTPFISINNTYGLGEAEVSGIVTSDTWIIDPSTGTILKRRMGEKGKKIVYDPIRKINVTVDTSVSDREKFAISKSKAKEIATLVKKIQEHYVKKNPDLNHMDIEYAVTDDGRIVFTQARPETVWTSGKRSLIAINAKEVEAKNKEAVKAGIELPYPEIFKGGVSGSPGVARGILRVVTSVQEAEESVKPGDIMIAPNTTNAWEHVMSRTSGIITEIGGPGNHTAVVSREQEKAAIVGAVGAMESLKIYSGKMVTLDATSKRVYLNDIPDRFKYMPDKVEPEYGGLFSQDLDESWTEAQRTMTTTQDPDGMRWINKPNQKVRVFLQEVFTRSHHQVAEMLNLNIKDRVKVDEENKNVGVYQVDFNTIFPWMTKLAEKPLEGADSLSSIHEARVANVRDFLQKSEDLKLTTTSVNAWLDSFITLNAYMGFAYNMYRITEGLLQEALKEKRIPEPYLSQVWLSMAAWVGETEAIKRNRDYGQLLEDVKNDQGLYEALKGALSNTDKEFNELAVLYPAFYSRFSEHAFNYKIMKNADDIFTSDPFHFLLAKELLKDADNHRTIAVYDTKPEQFYPEDREFERIARLAFFSEKLRQDAHHFKVRGQWKFVEVLRPLATFLIEKGEIKSFGDIFDHTPEWILDKVGEYEKAGSPNASVKSLFHIKQYQIQDLEVSNDEDVAEEDSAIASLTAMGRWKFESSQWDDAAGRLTLVNAMRIEDVLKPEFLENGQHSSRDIVLSTRKLNEQEHGKIDSLASSLGLDIKKVVIIKLDQTATFHRIYGLYANGISFIREDVLSEGNQNEIHEALDHLRWKPTGLGYEVLKRIQYYGNLRDLITRLSHRTIKTKLFAKRYTSDHVLELKGAREIRSEGTLLERKKIVNEIDGLSTKPGLTREHLLGAVYADLGELATEKTLQQLVGQVNTLPIDDSNEFIGRVSKPTHYVHIAGRIDSLAADLKVFAEGLLKQWGKQGRVTFVVKKERIAADSTVADIETFLQEAEFAFLRDMRIRGQFNVVINDSSERGTNFLPQNISPAFELVLKEVERRDAVLGLKGEENNLTADFIPYEHYRFLLTKDPITQVGMGIGVDTPLPVVVRVPAYLGLIDKKNNLNQTGLEFYKARNDFEQSGGDYDLVTREMVRKEITFAEEVVTLQKQQPKQKVDYSQLMDRIDPKLYSMIKPIHVKQAMDVQGQFSVRFYKKLHPAVIESKNVDMEILLKLTEVNQEDVVNVAADGLRDYLLEIVPDAYPLVNEELSLKSPLDLPTVVLSRRQDEAFSIFNITVGKLEETAQLESFLEKRPEAEIVYIAGYKKQFKPGEDSSVYTFIVKHNKEDTGAINIINYRGSEISI